jgi:phosphatidylglycerophosphate synthase
LLKAPPATPGLYARAKAASGSGGVVTIHVSNVIGAAVAATGMRLGLHPSLLSLANPLAAAIGSVPVIWMSNSARGWWWPGWLALVFWTLAYALDCADGQLARASGKQSEFGARVDVLADYGAQAIVVVAVVAVGNASQTLPTALIAVICSFWCFGTFAATLRRSDSIDGHSVLGGRPFARVMHSVLDTGLINLALGAWILISPATVIIPASVITVLNVAYLIGSLIRETHSSLKKRPKPVRPLPVGRGATDQSSVG